MNTNLPMPTSAEIQAVRDEIRANIQIEVHGGHLIGRYSAPELLDESRELSERYELDGDMARTERTGRSVINTNIAATVAFIRKHGLPAYREATYEN